MKWGRREPCHKDLEYFCHMSKYVKEKKCMEEIYLCNVKMHQNVQKSLLKVVHPKIDLDLLARLECRKT